MTTALRETLGDLAAVPGVQAAVAAAIPDGVAADAVAVAGLDVDALAAFATALFERTRGANAAAGFGDTHQLVLDAEGGRLFVAARGEIALVVLADHDAGAGLIRVSLRRALGAVA